MLSLMMSHDVIMYNNNTQLSHCSGPISSLDIFSDDLLSTEAFTFCGCCGVIGLTIPNLQMKVIVFNKHTHIHRFITYVGEETWIVVGRYLGDAYDDTLVLLGRAGPQGDGAGASVTSCDGDGGVTNGGLTGMDRVFWIALAWSTLAWSHFRSIVRWI